MLLFLSSSMLYMLKKLGVVKLPMLTLEQKGGIAISSLIMAIHGGDCVPTSPNIWLSGVDRLALVHNANIRLSLSRLCMAATCRRRSQHLRDGCRSIGRLVIRPACVHIRSHVLQLINLARSDRKCQHSPILLVIILTFCLSLRLQSREFTS